MQDYKHIPLVTIKSHLQLPIFMIKEIEDEEPYYSTKISIFSFIWAGLAALHKVSTI
jgi:hypothetical protein